MFKIGRGGGLTVIEKLRKLSELSLSCVPLKARYICSEPSKAVSEELKYITVVSIPITVSDS